MKKKEFYKDNKKTEEKYKSSITRRIKTVRDATTVINSAFVPVQ
jgi:hypothetical protein